MRATDRMVRHTGDFVEIAAFPRVQTMRRQSGRPKSRPNPLPVIAVILTVLVVLLVIQKYNDRSLPEPFASFLQTLLR